MAEEQKHPSVEEIAHHNNFLLNSLIEVLIKKNIISQQDLEDHIKSLQEQMMQQAKPE